VGAIPLKIADPPPPEVPDASVVAGSGVAAYFPRNLTAQDVAIANVRSGKIVSAGAGTADTQGLKVIDAKGMSAMLLGHVEWRMITGPRIIPLERINLRGTLEEVRAAVRAMAASGIRHTGEIVLTPEPGPTPQEIEILKTIVDREARVGVQVNVTSPQRISSLALAAPQQRPGGATRRPKVNGIAPKGDVRVAVRLML